jgi:hypothetical protein
MTQLKLDKDNVGRAHSKWIKENPRATLADLRRFLQEVYDEFLEFGGDEVLAEHIDSLDVAAAYLGEWGDLNRLNEPINDDGELATFDYRLGDLEDDIGIVDELIELVGDSFRVSRLRPRKKSA